MTEHAHEVGTIAWWSDYVAAGWYGPDEPHTEYDELKAEACETGRADLRRLADEWWERRRAAACSWDD